MFSIGHFSFSMHMFHPRICILWDHHQFQHNINRQQQRMIRLWQANIDIIFFWPRFIKKKSLPTILFFFAQVSSIPECIQKDRKTLSRYRALSVVCVCVALILFLQVWWWWCLSHRCTNSYDFSFTFFLCTVAWYLSFWSSIFFCLTLFFYVRSFILRRTFPVIFFVCFSFVRNRNTVP
jgi:hypothetical protein